MGGWVGERKEEGRRRCKALFSSGGCHWYRGRRTHPIHPPTHPPTHPSSLSASAPAVLSKWVWKNPRSCFPTYPTSSLYRASQRRRMAGWVGGWRGRGGLGTLGRGGWVEWWVGGWVGGLRVSADKRETYLGQCRAWPKGRGSPSPGLGTWQGACPCCRRRLGRGCCSFFMCYWVGVLLLGVARWLAWEGG